jgi:hypothetical protein
MTTSHPASVRRSPLSGARRSLRLALVFVVGILALVPEQGRAAHTPLPAPAVVAQIGGTENFTGTADARSWESEVVGEGTIPTITDDGHTATRLLDGRVLLAGGSALASAELYDPATGRFAPTGAMQQARTFHTATLMEDGRVLIVGGRASNQSLSSAEVYDPATGEFTATGAMQAARAGHTATWLPDDRVLVVGGYNDPSVGDTTYLNSAEIYDPATGSFTVTGAMDTARTRHTATLLDDGKVLIAGGD